MKGVPTMILVLAAVLIAGGCCRPHDEPAVVDREAVLAAIRQADIDFGLALSDHDLERFKAFVADDGAFYSSTGIVLGPDGVAEMWAVLLDPESGVSLLWQPHEAEVSDDATLGFTRGEWQMTRLGDDGATVETSGWYVTIWRKNEEGRWQATVDIGNPRETQD